MPTTTLSAHDLTKRYGTFKALAGAYMPLSAFPATVRAFSYVLPFTWGYDLLRFYSFDGRWETILPAWQEWVILGVSALVFTLVSRRLLNEAEKLAKRQGLHII